MKSKWVLGVALIVLCLTGCEEREKVEIIPETQVETVAVATPVEPIKIRSEVIIDSLYPNISINGKEVVFGEYTLEDLTNTFGEYDSNIDYGSYAVYIYRDENNMQNLTFTVSGEDGKISEILLTYPETGEKSKYNVDGMQYGYTIDELEKALGDCEKFTSDSTNVDKVYVWEYSDHSITVQTDDTGLVIWVQIMKKDIKLEESTLEYVLETEPETTEEPETSEEETSIEETSTEEESTELESSSMEPSFGYGPGYAETVESREYGPGMYDTETAEVSTETTYYESDDTIDEDEYVEDWDSSDD